MTHWSSGQDATLSRWNQGFDSPMGYHEILRTVYEIIPSFVILIKKTHTTNKYGGKNGL